MTSLLSTSSRYFGVPPYIAYISTSLFVENEGNHSFNAKKLNGWK